MIISAELYSKFEDALIEITQNTNDKNVSFQKFIDRTVFFDLPEFMIIGDDINFDRVQSLDGILDRLPKPYVDEKEIEKLQFEDEMLEHTTHFLSKGGEKVFINDNLVIAVRDILANISLTTIDKWNVSRPLNNVILKMNALIK